MLGRILCRVHIQYLSVLIDIVRSFHQGHVVFALQEAVSLKPAACPTMISSFDPLGEATVYIVRPWLFRISFVYRSMSVVSQMLARSACCCGRGPAWHVRLPQLGRCGMQV